MGLELNPDDRGFKTLYRRSQKDALGIIYNASSMRHDHVGKHVHELGIMKGVFNDPFCLKHNIPILRDIIKKKTCRVESTTGN